MTRPSKGSTAGFKPRSATLQTHAITTEPNRRYSHVVGEEWGGGGGWRRREGRGPGRITLSAVPLISSWTLSESVDWLVVGCLTSQQHASIYQGRTCTDNFTCCHTEIEAADPTFHLTQSQYTDTGPTSPSADPITPGAWQGSHWSASTRPRKNPGASGIRTRDLPLSMRTPYH